MRQKIIIGNWKMNLGPSGALALARSLKIKLTDIRRTTVAVCPPYVSLETTLEVLKETRIGIGAQNLHHEKAGAFTGEVSALMLREAGCKYVIIGHSERRQLFGETDEGVNKKLTAALQENLIPIVCVGETLEERENGQTENVINRQFHGALMGLKPEQLDSLIIAYEPVWAIGTGRNATPGQANDVHELIRAWMKKLHGDVLAERLPIQYGGSVKPDNAQGLLSKPDIDGALVGGASLDADAFASIVKTAEQLV